MMFKPFISTLLLLSTLLATSVIAAPIISSSEIKEQSAQGLRLLSLKEGEAPVWKTEKEVLDLLRAGVNFFDVTETYELETKLLADAANSKALPTILAYPVPSHQEELAPILSSVSISNMQNWLTQLTAFNNRYYRSSTGASASTWILNTVQDIARQYGRNDVTVSLFSHSWGQPSIIAKIPGRDPNAARTILGAHMDSINLNNPSSGRAPGADDDGTGTVNLIEAFRALLAANFRPSTPVEFQWYAAEEVGLLGSQAIATNYRSNGVQVKAFMELDMSGYFKPGTREVMAIQADYIDPALNEFLKLIITAYSRIPWAMDIPCGYACSDHASWNRQGYPATFPYEAITGDDNPTIHSASDTTSVNGFSWAHSVEFAKVAIAFVYELAI